MPRASSTRHLLGAILTLAVMLAALFALRAINDDDGAPGRGTEPTTAVVGPTPEATGTAIVDPAAWDPTDAAPGFADELALLDGIEQRERTGHDGYSREEFGERWADVDGNGCDTRNDVLARDLEDVELRPGTCLVQSGTLRDPYSGLVIAFERGPVTSEAVQIDHVVALYDAWRTGAAAWSPGLRRQLANDPANLRAVDGETNDAKGHADAATWLPPHEAYRCEYVAGQVRIKAAYGLWMTPAEHEASRRLLESC